MRREDPIQCILVNLKLKGFEFVNMHCFALPIKNSVFLFEIFSYARLKIEKILQEIQGKEVASFSDNSFCRFSKSRSFIHTISFLSKIEQKAAAFSVPDVIFCQYPSFFVAEVKFFAPS